MNMKRSNTQFERQVDIDRRIRAEEFPSVPELADAWEVDARTIKRDVEFMRDRLLAPIVYDRKRRGYTYSEPSWSLPAIPMKEGDLFSLLLARHALEQYENLPTSDALEHVFSYITGSVGRALRLNPEKILADFSFIPPPSISIDSDIWSELCQSMLRRHTVKMDYQSRSKREPRTYRVDPLHVANIHGEWYVFARSHYKGDIIQFAIGRMVRVAGTDEPFERPVDFNAEEIVHNTFGGFSPMNQKQVEVRVLVSDSWLMEVSEKQWHPDQKVIHRKNGDIEIRFPVSAEGTVPFLNVISWVLSMGRHARVLAPKKLKQLVADEIQAMGAG